MAALYTAVMKEDDHVILVGSSNTENFVLRQRHCTSQVIIKIHHNTMVSRVACMFDIFVRLMLIFPRQYYYLSFSGKEKSQRHRLQML